MDSNVQIGTHLFQVYFNMSMAVGQELNYLEKKEAELMDYLERMVAEGDTSARDRRRMVEEGGVQTVEVKNPETKKMKQALVDTQNSLETLSEQLIKLKQLN